MSKNQIFSDATQKFGKKKTKTNNQIQTQSTTRTNKKAEQKSITNKENNRHNQWI